MARQELGLVDPPPADVRRVAVIDGRINQVQARAGSPGGEAGRVNEAGLGIIPAVGMATSRRRDDKVKP
jgi:hypothetical protein